MGTSPGRQKVDDKEDRMALMQSYEEASPEDLERGARYWWVFLISGILWLIISLVILRLDLTTVFAIGILFGVMVIMAGVNEFVALTVAPGWKWLHGILGVLFVLTGIACLVYPGRTFITLAAIFSWFLLFKGTFDITVSILTRGVNELWWLQLITGIVELGLAFWAAGYFAGSVTLLIVWVGIATMLRGVTEIILAFTLRKGGRDLAAA
jgi:uncharacterized membrane protein HdeD (DUF308 family)